jgi:hypothetical protein
MIGTGNVATDRSPKRENHRAEYPVTYGRAGHRDRSDAAQLGGYFTVLAETLIVLRIRGRAGDRVRCRGLTGG